MDTPLVDKLYDVANSTHEIAPIVASALNLYYDYIDADMPKLAAEELGKAIAAMLYYEMEYLVKGLEDNSLKVFTINHN